jgi:hypothetical protein
MANHSQVKDLFALRTNIASRSVRHAFHHRDELMESASDTVNDPWTENCLFARIICTVFSTAQIA